MGSVILGDACSTGELGCGQDCLCDGHPWTCETDSFTCGCWSPKLECPGIDMPGPQPGPQQGSDPNSLVPLMWKVEAEECVSPAPAPQQPMAPMQPHQPQQQH